MSWTDCFPILTDEMIELFQSEVTSVENEILDLWFSVEQVLNPQPDRFHVVAASLFWKRDALDHDELPEVTRELMMNAAKLGLAGRFPPWEHYVLPLMEGAKLLHRERDDAIFRVYLANDLSFLIEDLVGIGCEVMVMKSSSIRHNPGAMWRFLALEEVERAVTITDSDRAKHILSDVARTEAARQAEVGGWRVAYNFGGGYATRGWEGYRPIIACQFGSIKPHALSQTMKAFVWHSLRGSLPETCKIGPDREVPIPGTQWPDYGFDEWFLLAAVYPRMAAEGLLTFFPWDVPPFSQFFALDIEYATWANPSSELVYYDDPDKQATSASAYGD
jgi:hypothetical protein